ncbi:MAG: methyltransferase domain-containing protein [Rhodobacteraceae bacterium]|nr:methyltransferase domain-containing protein [Paracoccaceae bacterium]
MKLETVRENVQAYYGDVLQSSADLQTNACCMPDDVPAYVRNVLAKLHDDVMARYYGCGLIAPLDLKGMRILDLGCGAGRDVYALSALVGETGEVVGVDMTKAQLDVAMAHREFHAKAFGFAESNVTFHHGYIEKLDELDLEPGSFDIIVSNCVLNLATDKGAVLRGAHTLLREGGEMYFSDVYGDRRIPEALAKDQVLYGECLSGALYWNDFLNLAKAAGFTDPRAVTRRMLTIENPELEAKVAPLKFLSVTYRLFKLDGLEPACEDYGQAVTYKGSVEHAKGEFALDEGHVMTTGQRFEVCGNTYRMLKQSRFARHFEFDGDFSVHNGIFAGCGGNSPFDGLSEGGASGGSCCG